MAPFSTSPPPVNIDIYNEYGVRVGRIVNNEVVEMNIEEVVILIEDDAIYIVMPYYADYTLNFIATGESQLDVTIKDVPASPDSPFRGRVFENINLTHGRTITGEIVDAPYARLLVMENGTPIAEINEDGTETPLHTITGAITLPNPTHPVTAQLRRDSVADPVVSTSTIHVTRANATTPASFTISAPPGTYTLIFSQPGHTSFTINNIIIPEGGGNINLSQDPRFPQRLPLHPGDVNGDGQVNISDLNLLLQNWLGNYVNANFTGDGQINISDLNLLLQNWMAVSVVVD